MIDHHLLQSLRSALAVTLSVNVQTLGPAPDDVGAVVKELLAGDDDVALIALGCYLDEARAAGSWDLLRLGLAEIKVGQAKRAKP